MQGRRRKENDRYNNPVIGSLLEQLQEQHESQWMKSVTQLRQQRKMHHSLSLIQSRRNDLQTRPLFNNKTREGSLIDKKVKPVPYIFIPKYKNDTFIMPDKVFAKGKTGRRFHIKMKDTSIYSFREPENEDIRSVIRKEQKDKTIVSRQVEQFNRVMKQVKQIMEENDGVVKKQHNTHLLKTRKRFDYAHTGSELFSQCQPLLGIKEPQKLTARKVSLAKTHDFSRRWRPNSRNMTSFNQTYKSTPYQHNPGRSSVL